MPATALFVIAAAFGSGCALTAGARWLAPRLGFLDRPDGQRKRHARPTPLMGGAAIGGAFLLSTVLLAAAMPGLPNGSPGASRGLFPLLASAGLFCLLGLYDDRCGLRPRWKIAGQIAASLPFVVWGESIGTVGVLGIQCSLGVWSAPFTIFWLVACSNVINLMDGMDGLAGTICFIALLTLAALSMLMGRYGVAGVTLVAAASVAGFLVHNWPPAKIFLGDSGSLMLGFLLGALAIQASLKQAAGFMLVVPLVLISVPVFDTAMAILRRKLAGRGISEADRGHIHHRLLDQGLSRTQSLLLIAGLSIAMSGFCVLSFLANSELLALLLCCSLLAALVIARVFGHHETELALQHLRVVGRLLRDASRMLPSRLWAVRLTNMGPEQCDDFWRMACGRLAQCGGRDLEVRFTDVEDLEVLQRLSWTADEPAVPMANTWQVKHTVHRDRGIRATLTANGTADGSEWGARLSEASELIHTLGRAWPLAVPSDASDGDRLLDLDVICFEDAEVQAPQSLALPREAA